MEKPRLLFCNIFLLQCVKDEKIYLTFFLFFFPNASGYLTQTPQLRIISQFFSHCFTLAGHANETYADSNGALPFLLNTYFKIGDNLPSIEQPQGPYPTYIKQSSGKVVPVVQAYCYSKYVGKLDLYFDADGELKVPVDGAGVQNAQPHLLDNSIKIDEEVLKVIEKYRPNMTDYTTDVGVITTKLATNGSRETNIGNAIADSMVKAGEWVDATIGFMNNGGIRSVPSTFLALTKTLGDLNITIIDLNLAIKII
jgi:hypothetical protein